MKIKVDLTPPANDEFKSVSIKFRIYFWSTESTALISHIMLFLSSKTNRRNWAFINGGGFLSGSVHDKFTNCWHNLRQ